MNDLDKLAKDHWEYIKSLLLTHDEDPNVIEKIGFHYISAFIHGYKHGADKYENYKGDINQQKKLDKMRKDIKSIQTGTIKLNKPFNFDKVDIKYEEGEGH